MDAHRLAEALREHCGVPQLPIVLHFTNRSRLDGVYTLIRILEKYTGVITLPERSYKRLVEVITKQSWGKFSESRSCVVIGLQNISLNDDELAILARDLDAITIRGKRIDDVPNLSF